MDQEWKRKWVEALRSGKYKQGRGVLRSEDNEFCCLGVLSDIVAPDGWFTNSYGEWCHTDHNASGLPPRDVLDAVGIETRSSEDGFELKRTAWVENVQGWDSNLPSSLDNLNDAGWTFAEIADLIEGQL